MSRLSDANSATEYSESVAPSKSVAPSNPSNPSTPRAWSIYNQQGDREIYPYGPEGNDYGETQDFGDVNEWIKSLEVSQALSKIARFKLRVEIVDRRTTAKVASAMWLHASGVCRQITIFGSSSLRTTLFRRMKG